MFYLIFFIITSVILLFFIFRNHHRMMNMKKGVILAWETPTLPDNILKLTMHPLIRILRVLGGISLLILLSNRVLIFPTYLQYYIFIICLFIASIFTIYHLYLTYHRIKHIRFLIQKGAFDIRNSPLDRFGDGRCTIFLNEMEKCLGYKRHLPESTTKNTIPTESNSNTLQGSNSLFLLLSNFYKKIPDWLKYILNFLIIIYLVLKLLGFTSIDDFIINIYYIKIYFYVGCSFLIFYQFITLYFIYLFSTKDIKISEILPTFFINWLKNIQILSQDENSKKWLIQTSYQHIVIYTVLLIMAILLI